MTAYLCMALVGVVFLATGTLKALDPRSFLRQLGEYKLIPRQHAQLAALAFIALEFLVGGALLLSFATGLVVPVVFILLLFLSGLTLWAASAKRVEDCGCYGGALLLTPRQSVLLNCGYLALLAAAWLLRGEGFVSPLPAAWATALLLTGTGAGVLVARRSIQRGPLVDFTHVKVGRRWQEAWFPKGSPSLENGDHFVVFMSQNCPYCKQWIPFLNVVEVQPQSPRVLGVMAMTGTEQEAFLAQHMIRFPILTVSDRRLATFADAYPTAALIQGGVIREKWVGELPKPYVEQTKRFHEAITVGSAPAARRGFAG